MKFTRFIPLLILLFLSLACSSSLVTIEDSAYKDFDLSIYQTFDFLEVENTNPENPNFENAISLLIKDVEDEMLKRGLKKSSNPDLKINLGLVVEDKVQTRTTSLATDPFMYTGQRRYTWESKEVPVNTYKEGSITMHLVDSKSNKAVWVGSINRVVPKKDEKKAEAIDFAVSELFNEIDN
ncbi:DUF4136 domain-containing protein [Algoriphagus sp. SE2]|uniref:DUF4136 domain-containing protein n=1 Tax=Algoriphagus sp. SE2 TaxID=3141536 RepID=UPI0031CD788A